MIEYRRVRNATLKQVAAHAWAVGFDDEGNREFMRCQGFSPAQSMTEFKAILSRMDADYVAWCEAADSPIDSVSFVDAFRRP